MKILFGFGDVLTLDAWLAFFEQKGHEVDGAMSGEDLIGVAGDFKPDLLVSEYKLNGEVDGLGVFYELSTDPATSGTKLILITELSNDDRKKLNKKFIQSGRILAVIRPTELSFEAVEELL
jgi:DNA-binding response OmpR family regulator